MCSMQARRCCASPVAVGATEADRNEHSHRLPAFFFSVHCSCDTRKQFCVDRFAPLVNASLCADLEMATHSDVEGVSDHRQAVIQGAMERVSPILMTALAAGLALIPVALGMGKPGSEIEAPMALVILGGLLSSTFLNMVVVPAAYFRFGRLGR